MILSHTCGHSNPTPADREYRTQNCNASQATRLIGVNCNLSGVSYCSVNLLKPSGFFTYHQGLTFKNGARFVLSVLCGYQNRQRLLL